jgi:hypothetical protein
MTMQWMLFHFPYKDPTPSWWDAIAVTCRRWASTLGAGYSCSMEGDGPRSMEATLRRNRQRRVKYNAKIQHRRHLEDLQQTGSEAPVVPILHPSPLPHPRGTRTRPMRVAPQRVPDPSALSFYDAHPGSNHWLELRTGNNITGLDEDKSVFARRLIPPNTRLAPYLGQVCPPSTQGPYCLQVRDADNALVCVDATGYLFDTGYISSLSPLENGPWWQFPPTTGVTLTPFAPTNRWTMGSTHSLSPIRQKASRGLSQAYDQ